LDNLVIHLANQISLFIIGQHFGRSVADHYLVI